jgi:phosphatidylglycerophosphate synthase
MAIIAKDFANVQPLKADVQPIRADIHPDLFRDAAMHLILSGVGLAAGCLLAFSVFGIGWRGAVTALACYGVMALFVMAGLARHAHPPRFGFANAITLTRAAMTALLYGIGGEWLFGGLPALGEGLRWTLAIMAALILILDGLDGPVARRSGMASPFGARFDMESDALFVLAVCWLVMATGAAGAWMLAFGSLHYAFLLAGMRLPWLNGPLEPARRRKVIYVAQASAPTIGLTPFCPPGVAWTLCAVAFLLVLFSFATDIVTLLSRESRSDRDHAAAM